jgi:hypothetical protein
MPSSQAKARRRTALDELIVKQAPQQQKPEPRIQDARRGAKGGRTRLDLPKKTSRKGFASFCHALARGPITRGEAARRLRVSHRSLSRYLRMASVGEP